MSKVRVAPDPIYTKPEGYKSLFLAGGITGCPDWQSYMIEALKDYKVLIYNPRRTIFPMNDPSAAEEQIRWEFERLRDADMALFWFSKGSDNPIVLFEYGRHGFNVNRPIFLGIDPEYKRKQDVIVQTRLEKGTCTRHDNLHSLAMTVASQLAKEPARPETGKQPVDVFRFVHGNQGELRPEGTIVLDVTRRKMELPTFRICCSDFVQEAEIMTAPFLGKQFILACTDSKGEISRCKGKERFAINLSSGDPLWCRKCGAAVTTTGMPGPLCNSCCPGCL